MTNIASGTSDNAQNIAQKGGISKVMELISSDVQEIQEQAVWCLGNMAGDSFQLRKRIIDEGGFNKIIKTLTIATRPSLIKQCVWAISNFCRTKPQPEFYIMEPCIDLVVRSINIMGYQDDLEFTNDATWTLSFMSESYKKSVKKILDSNILPTVLKCLE